MPHRQALLPVFADLQASPLGETISGSSWMFPTIETLHVFALTVVAGTILIVDLRLLGLASKEQRVTALSKTFLPWTWGAFAAAVVTGVLLFASRAGDYSAIPQFVFKFVVMGLAGLNMAAFHFVTWRTVGDWDIGPPVAGAKIAGALSLLSWAVIILLGRTVGFIL